MKPILLYIGGVMPNYTTYIYLPVYPIYETYIETLAKPNSTIPCIYIPNYTLYIGGAMPNSSILRVYTYLPTYLPTPLSI